MRRCSFSMTPIEAAVKAAGAYKFRSASQVYISLTDLLV